MLSFLDAGLLRDETGSNASGFIYCGSALMVSSLAFLVAYSIHTTDPPRGTSTPID